MDDEPRSPASASAPPNFTPPPVIGLPPISMNPYGNQPPRGSGAIWKILAVVFLLMLLLSLLVNFSGLSRGIMPRNRGSFERSHELQEVVLESTNSNNKIAVIEVDGVISSSE